jgi:hypothetical protein
LACAGRASLQRAGEAQEGFVLLEEAVPSQLTHINTVSRFEESG